MNQTEIQYIRQSMLPEIGSHGQLRLQNACLSINLTSDPVVTQITTDYLKRAGIHFDDNGSLLPSLPTSRVDEIAGKDQYKQAAAFLLGALAAVESIKQIVHVGEPMLLDHLSVKLSEDDCALP